MDWDVEKIFICFGVGSSMGAGILLVRWFKYIVGGFRSSLID